MKKIAYIACTALALFSLALFSGCQKSPELLDVILVTGTDIDPMVKFAVETTPATYSLSATATTLVQDDVNVRFEVDGQALKEYNAVNGTNYFLMPAESYELLDPSVVIKAGKNTSGIATIRINSLDELSDEASYVIPLSITNETGGLSVLNAGRTIFLRVSQVLDFVALDITPNSTANNMYGYKTFFFDQGLEMTAYTFEIKVLIDSWHTAGDGTTITRLANWGPGDENPDGTRGPFNRTTNSMCLLRFGEGGYAKDQLQWLTSNGALATIEPFLLNRWYLLSFTYDGFTYRLYVDGKLVNSMDAVGAVQYFDTFEIGMSWDGDGNVYPQRQKMPGRISETRMWNRALKAKELQTGICGVPSDSPGLVAYWKFNEGEGFVYHDSTGGGRDLQGHSGATTGNARGYFRWVSDDKNKCAQ